MAQTGDKARIVELERALAQALAQGRGPRTFTMKQSDRQGRDGSPGAVMLYGLGRFPVTLYVDQWAQLVQLVQDGWIGEHLEQARAGTLEVKHVEDKAAYESRTARLDRQVAQGAPLRAAGFGGR